jgi:glycosyltransferase involved in cell wall biosynthesis
MPSPPISVLMSVYNGSDYVQQSVQSILNQTLDDYEFVIVEDGSTDNTLEILKSFHDCRINLLINRKNIGLTKSLNHAIHKVISGDFVARIDADDVARSSMLELMMGYLEANAEVGAVGSVRNKIDSENRIIETWVPPLSNSDIQKTLLAMSVLPHGGAMFRTVCLREVGGYDESLRYAQDYDLALRITEQWDAVNLKLPLYDERIHDGRISVQHSVMQETTAELIRYKALRRRLKARFGYNTGEDSIYWSEKAHPGWLAKRYIWWSAAARMVDRRYALLFLIRALIYDPREEEIREYVKGILTRKWRRILPT